MDFHSLARRDLQALCKLNAIPANITNLAMADALASLDIVQGIEDFLNRSPERKAVTAAKVRRTTTQSKPIGNGSESVQTMMTQSTRRTTRRGISDEIMAESKTPAIRSSRKTVELAKTEGIEDVEKKDVSDTPALATYNQVARKSSVKEVSTVQRVYSTRRSARLNDNIAVEEKEEKIDSLVSELSRIDLGDGSDNKSLSEVVLQESAEEVDVVALETVNNLKDNEALDEFNAVQEGNTKSLVTENEEEGDVQEEIVEELEESEQLDEPQFFADSGVIKDEDCKVLWYPVNTENSYEQTKSDEAAAPESGTKLKGNDAQKIVVDELKEKSEQCFNTHDESLDEFNAVQEGNTKSLVTENEEEGDVQEEIVEELEESEQLDEPQFFADSGVIKDEDCKVLWYPVNTENSYEQTKSDEAAAPESGTKLKGNDAQKIVVDELKEKSEQCFNTHDESLDEFNAVQEGNTKSLVTENEEEGDVQEEIVEELEESEQLDEPQFFADSGVIKDEDCKVLWYPVDTENSYEQTKSDEAAAPESGTKLKGNDAQKIVVDELKEKSEQCFNTHDESHFVNEVNSNNVMIEAENSKVEKSLMDSDNPREQLDLGAGEEYATNKNLESVVIATAELSAGGDSYLVEHMTYSDESNDEILDNDDHADQTEEMDSEIEPSVGESEVVQQIACFEESKADILNNNDPKEIATGTEISSIAPFVSSGGEENKPVTKTPSVKGLNSVSDDKENIDRNGIKFELTKEGAKKDKKEIDPAALNAKSLRELTKMLKEKLQISNNTAEEIGKVTKERPALQKLEDNCQR